MGSRLFRSPEPLLILVPGVMSRPPVTGHARFYQLILFFSVSPPANNISAFANNLQDVHAICNTLDPRTYRIIAYSLDKAYPVLLPVTPLHRQGNSPRKVKFLPNFLSPCLKILYSFPRPMGNFQAFLYLQCHWLSRLFSCDSPTYAQACDQLTAAPVSCLTCPFCFICLPAKIA